MKAEGRISVNDLHKIKYYKKAKRLNEELIAKGNVLKATLVAMFAKFSVDLLFVAPESSVVMHEHNNSSEWYIDLEGNSMDFCAMGETHELVNTSKDNWLVVLAIKKFY